MIGANVQPHVVIITGVAARSRTPWSMGASGYLAAKSEAEVQAHQIEMERCARYGSCRTSKKTSSR